MNKIILDLCGVLTTTLCKVCHNEVIKERSQRPENLEKIRIYKREYFRKHYAKRK